MTQNTMSARRFLLFILVAALIAPHTFEISGRMIPDGSFTRYSLILVLLTLFYESGTNIAGPYSTGFILPPTSAILLNVLTLIINISIILSQWQYTIGSMSRKNVLYVIGLALCVHVLLLIGFFSYQLDATASVLSIPLPIFPIISALVVLRGKIPSP
ncbi:MAG: hypothetical protein ACFFEW_15695 [Candidatus Thorarchaeota archaeon]